MRWAQPTPWHLSLVAGAIYLPMLSRWMSRHGRSQVHSLGVGVGLLGCLLDLPFASIINQDYGTFKGYVAENFVAQELSCLGTAELYSWTGRAAEIEFVRQIGADIVPVEVKSGIRTRARSLSAYSAKYHPPWKIKLSARNLSIGKDGTLNLPLYLAGSVDDLRPRAS